ncbi:MAG: hypothetical protein ACRD1Z_09175, partial [Vicinamibacteria bacterium]
SGSGVVGYIVAGLPEKDPLFRNFEADHPTGPWSVVVREVPGSMDYVIEGYGEDLAKPLFVETVTIGVLSGEGEAGGEVPLYPGDRAE